MVAVAMTLRRNPGERLDLIDAEGSRLRKEIAAAVVAVGEGFGPAVPGRARGIGGAILKVRAGQRLSTGGDIGGGPQARRRVVGHVASRPR